MCSRHLAGQLVHALKSNRRVLGFSTSSLLIPSVNEKLILPSFPLLLSCLTPHLKKRNTKNIINYLLSGKPKNCEQNVYCKRLISNFYSKRNVTKTWCIYSYQYAFNKYYIQWECSDLWKCWLKFSNGSYILKIEVTLKQNQR